MGYKARHFKISFALAGALSFGFTCAISTPAKAGLVGDNNSVSALFYLGASGVPIVTSSTAPYTIPAPFEIEGPNGPTNPPPPPSLIPAAFIAGASDDATIDVGDTQIVITNGAPPSMPFCSVAATPCPDVFTGFGFVFFGSVDITNVTVDPSSAADFLPTAGGLTFGASDIFVNLVGDAPAVDDKLILDVTTKSATPTVPEPATLPLVASGLGALGLLGWRRKRKAQAVA